MTATSADGCCTKRWVVAAVGVGGGLGGFAEGTAEEVYGVALEAEPDVCVYRRGHSDVGVTQQLLDHDEFYALFQEECRGRVPQISTETCFHYCARVLQAGGVPNVPAQAPIRELALFLRRAFCVVRVSESNGDPAGRGGRDG